VARLLPDDTSNDTINIVEMSEHKDLARNTQYIRWKSVQTYRDTILALYTDFHKPLPLAKYTIFKDELVSHSGWLKTSFDLRGNDKKKVTYRTLEVKILIEELLDPAHLVDADAAIQMVAIILMFYYTAARLGSLLTVPGSPSFIKLKNLEFHRRLVHPGRGESNGNGKTLGFDVMITYDIMKGYQSTAEIDNKYYSRTMYEDKNIIFDLGSVLVALFCRHGLIKKGGKVMTGKEVWDR
jgi:hypothetical protein